MADSMKMLMRSLTALVLVFCLTLSAAATDTDSDVSADNENTTSQSEQLTEEEEDKEPTTQEPEEDEEEEETEVPAPKITKHPTGETITAGETALFVARADYASDIEWKVLSSNAKNTYDIDEAVGVYKGLKYSGETSETLRLENIPIEMNGCSIFAEFEGPGGKSTSKAAVLTVQKEKLYAPSIMQNPRSAAVKLGEDAMLTIKVVDPNEDTQLFYQWYKTDSPTAISGSPVSGATSVTFHPPTDEAGTSYYFVKVWCKSEDQTSPQTASEVASVAVAPAVAETEPTTEATTEPTTQASDETEDTTPEIITPAPQKKRSKTPLIILLFILLVLAFIATIAAVILMRRDALLEGDDDYDDDDSLLPRLPKLPPLPKFPVKHSEPARFESAKAPSAPKHVPEDMAETMQIPVVPPVVPPTAPPVIGWRCTCGAMNRGSFCTDCGSPKVTEPPKTICPNCGFDSSVLSKIPKFCPECGKPFGAEPSEAEINLDDLEDFGDLSDLENLDELGL